MFKILYRNFFNMYSLILFACLILSIVVRVKMVEADVPVWEKYNYQPIDEGFYVTSALNVYHHGTVTLDKYLGPQKDAITGNLFGSFVTVVTLFIFKNTYLGLRGGSIFASALSMIFLALIIKKILDYENIEKKLFVYRYIVFTSILLLFALTPGMIYVGIFTEPTGFRILGTLAALYYGMKIFEKEFSHKNGFYLGVIFTSAVLFFYPSNAFILLGSSVTWLAYGLENRALSKPKTFFMCVAFYVGGVIVTFLFYLLLIKIIFGKYITLPMGIFLPRIGDLAQTWSYAQNIFSASFLRDNPPLVLGLGMLSILFFKISSRTSVALLWNCSLAFIIQSLFLNDYPERKMIFLFPFAAIYLASALSCLSNLDFKDFAKKHFTPIFLAIILTLLCLNLKTASIYMQTLNPDSIAVYTVFASMMLLILSLGFIGKKYRNFFATLFIIIFFAPMLRSSYMQSKELINRRTYFFKDTMVEMGKIIPKNAIVFSGYSYGFALYGEWLPVGNGYVHSHRSGSGELAYNYLKSTLNGRPIYTINDSVLLNKNKFEEVASFDKALLSMNLPKGNQDVGVWKYK